MDSGYHPPQRIVATRLVPDEPLPPYSYVTGRFPHPTRDAAGHSYGTPPLQCPQPDPQHWRECRPYLFGIDLFNGGYYWEAHEVWESVWHACGRTGMTADFIKGLIKLAAAGVKAREGRLGGVRSHAQRAAELFRQTAAELPPPGESYFGLSLSELIGFAIEVAGSPAALGPTTGSPVEIVFPFVLRP